MATQEDTNKGYVSRASSFSYCGRKLISGEFVKNLCLQYSPNYNAQRGDVHTDKVVRVNDNYCGEHNEYWQLMCVDCARKLGIEW